MLINNVGQLQQILLKVAQTKRADMFMQPGGGMQRMDQPEMGPYAAQEFRARNSGVPSKPKAPPVKTAPPKPAAPSKGYHETFIGPSPEPEKSYRPASWRPPAQAPQRSFWDSLNQAGYDFMYGKTLAGFLPWLHRMGNDVAYNATVGLVGEPVEPMPQGWIVQGPTPRGEVSMNGIAPVFPAGSEGSPVISMIDGPKTPGIRPRNMRSWLSWMRKADDVVDSLDDVGMHIPSHSVGEGNPLRRYNDGVGGSVDPTPDTELDNWLSGLLDDPVPVQAAPLSNPRPTPTPPPKSPETPFYNNWVSRNRLYQDAENGGAAFFGPRDSHPSTLQNLSTFRLRPNAQNMEAANAAAGRYRVNPSDTQARVDYANAAYDFMNPTFNWPGFTTAAAGVAGYDYLRNGENSMTSRAFSYLNPWGAASTTDSSQGTSGGATRAPALAPAAPAPAPNNPYLEGIDGDPNKPYNPWELEY